MAGRVLGVLIVAALVGVGARAVWGVRIGIGVGVLLMMVGLVILVLSRNQKDLEELEQGKTPEAVDRVLGDDQ